MAKEQESTKQGESTTTTDKPEKVLKTPQEELKTVMVMLEHNRKIRISNGFEKAKESKRILYNRIVKTYNAYSMKKYSLDLDNSKTVITFRNFFILKKICEFANLSKEGLNLIQVELLNSETDLILDFNLWVKMLCQKHSEELLE